MRHRPALVVALTALLAGGNAHALFMLIDDFNHPDTVVIDQPGSGATVVAAHPGLPFARWVSHNLLTGPNDINGTGSRVNIGAAAFPVGSLEVANANGRDSEVTLGWTIGAGIVPTTAAGAASIAYTILRSDGNPIRVDFFVNNISQGFSVIPGNTRSGTNTFALNPAAQNALAAGGTLKLVINGDDGWDLSLDSLGIQVPEPGAMGLVGLALVFGGLAVRRLG